MSNKCPDCDGKLYEEHSMVFGRIQKCSKCQKSYVIIENQYLEVFSDTKVCPTCNSIMHITQDNRCFYFKDPKAYYYHCSRCGNSYTVSGSQLNDSKFNKRKAEDIKTSDKMLSWAFICFILLIAYIFVGYFFFSINFIILGILIVGIIICSLGYWVFGNQMYL